MTDGQTSQSDYDGCDGGTGALRRLADPCDGGTGALGRPADPWVRLSNDLGPREGRIACIPSPSDNTTAGGSDGLGLMDGPTSQSDDDGGDGGGARAQEAGRPVGTAVE